MNFVGVRGFESESSRVFQEEERMGRESSHTVRRMCDVAYICMRQLLLLFSSVGRSCVF